MKKTFTLAKVHAKRGNIPSIKHRRSWIDVIGAKVCSKVPPPAEEGFTLAEVLITLGIIGVVAAITIPNLIQNNFEKRAVSTLLETQSILSQAIRMAEEEYGDVSGWGIKGNMSQRDGITIANNLSSYMKIAIDCGYTNKKRCIPDTKYKLLNGNMWDKYTTTSMHYAIKLPNGSSIWFRGGNSNEIATDEAYITFFIDINGQNLPNTVGKDMFSFKYEKGGLKPCGAPGSALANTCSLDKAGWGCAYTVLQNQNMSYLH